MKIMNDNVIVFYLNIFLYICTSNIFVTTYAFFSSCPAKIVTWCCEIVIERAYKK